MHYTARKGRKEIVELLIGNGTDINAKDDNGYDPLLGAASRDHKEIAELLLPYDADVNALSVNGNTPQDYANDEISYVLRKHEAKTKVELESTGTAKRFNENSLPVSVALATRAGRSRVMVRGVDVKFQRISHQPSV